MRTARLLLTVATAAVLALAAHAGEERTEIPGTGTDRTIIQKSEPTSAGTFDGTWMYVNRDVRFALWIRTKDGSPQVKLQFQSLANPEAFETDWDGKAVYYLAGTPVTFEVKLGKRNAQQITGTWSWILQADGTGRRETADIVMYRTMYGRTLVMDFQNYEKIITRNGKDALMKVPFNWTWNKISNRELIWDELPF